MTSTSSVYPNSTVFHDSGVDKTYNLVAERITINVITGVLGVLSLYVAVSQVVFCILSHVIAHEKSENHDHARSLNILCAFASITTLLRIGLPMEFVIGYDTDSQCFAVMEYRIITYGLAFATLYTILWLRQRAFHWSPALRSLSTPLVRFLSLATPFIIWPGCVATMVIVNFSERFYSTIYGCAIEHLALNNFAWGFRGVSFFLMQCNLLYLLSYPLLQHRRAMRKGLSIDTCAIDFLLKRALFTTVVCMVMDTTSSLVGLLYKRDLAIIPHFVYDVNILIDLIAVIISFKNWRQRLFPWKKLGNYTRNRTLDDSTREPHSAMSNL